MYYYKQIDRQTGDILSYISCINGLSDNHETIQLVEISKDAYSNAIASLQGEDSADE